MDDKKESSTTMVQAISMQGDIIIEATGLRKIGSSIELIGIVCRVVSRDNLLFYIKKNGFKGFEEMS